MMIVFIMETNKATPKKLFYEIVSGQMVLQRGNSWVAIQQRCSNNQKLKKISIIHKLAQELNKKRIYFFK
jgi:hypothetical protein